MTEEPWEGYEDGAPPPCEKCPPSSYDRREQRIREVYAEEQKRCYGAPAELPGCDAFWSAFWTAVHVVANEERLADLAEWKFEQSPEYKAKTMRPPK